MSGPEVGGEEQILSKRQKTNKWYDISTLFLAYSTSHRVSSLDKVVGFSTSTCLPLESMSIEVLKCMALVLAM